MLKAFLEEIHEDLLSQRNDIASNLADLENHVKENQKFLDVLILDNDDVFNDFSPRNVNHKNIDKIEQLEDSITHMKESILLSESELREVDDKLEKWNRAYNEYKKISGR